MADRTPAETIRRAVTALRCQHRRTAKNPGTPGWKPDQCDLCGLPPDVTYGAGLVDQELRGPLADVLEEAASVYDLAIEFGAQADAATLSVTHQLNLARAILREAT